MTKNRETHCKTVRVGRSGLALAPVSLFMVALSFSDGNGTCSTIQLKRL